MHLQFFFKRSPPIIATSQTPLMVELLIDKLQKNKCILLVQVILIFLSHHQLYIVSSLSFWYYLIHSCVLLVGSMPWAFPYLCLFFFLHRWSLLNLINVWDVKCLLAFAWFILEPHVRETLLWYPSFPSILVLPQHFLMVQISKNWFLVWEPREETYVHLLELVL